jgi:hypothetical protein
MLRQLGLLAAMLCLAAAGCANAAPRISGIWTNITYNPESVYEPRLGVLKTSDGQMPPLQPWALALLEQRIKDSGAGTPFANTKSMCLPSGVPQLMFGPRTPMQILETPGQVTMLIEEFNDFRIVRLNAAHETDPDPNIMGDSIGRWEGDTLVIDTIGLSERTVLDVPGMPHSDQLHVVERVRLIEPDVLEVVVTLDDPKTFTRPWTARAAFRRAPFNKIGEYYCENQRNLSQDGKIIHQMPAAK